MSPIKESLQNAIANLSEEDCVQVMGFIQDLQHKSESHYVADEDLFEYVNGVLVVKATLDEGVTPEDLEFAVEQDRAIRDRKLEAW
ncbi:MAG: hypothetical protein J0L70_22470 [Leptolyngbya sp. UWPOB_LEPTO1]|uniref:hypothetical protein n=1 Tax=Leptolyngbya sp. UWPOB_LEPTO1 TaxID=2815653 RepID=UPI001AC8308F|nr:hypothetical protein [Leptolyngbya sp. UWPOB_LEPTO1]MBN8563306.1 hypothetical protein [Leptolyngbya sp. UWPOB_LEPTO1]